MDQRFEAMGRRLALRRLTIEDSPLIVKWRNQDWVRKNYIYRETFTVEGQEKYYHSKVETGLVDQFIICEKDKDMRPIGCTVFSDKEPETGYAEVGMFLGEQDATGKGYSIDMMHMTLEYGFTVLGLKNVSARIFTDNLPSLKGAINGGGLKLDKLIRNVECSDGSHKDMFLVSADCRTFSYSGKDDFILLNSPGNMISFVLPCYYSEKTLEGVVDEIDAAMERIPGYRHEIIMVNDGSTDGTWNVISSLCEKPGRYGIEFARNFGQHAALMAGIRKACGDIIVCLDDDGQTPADEVGKLIEAINNGADVVYAEYDHKQHSAFRNFGTMMNEKMCEIMIGKPKELFVSSYFAMKRFVADEVIRYENSYPYLLGLVLRATRNIVNVPVNHRKRTTGQSGYNFGKLLGLWMNGFTAFSIMPLRIATTMGAVCAGLGFIYGIYTIIKKIVNPNVPVGFSAMMTAIIFFGGMIMLMLGLAGEYIGRTYISVNKAPQSVIRRTTFTDTDN